jgi:hypothetical protein
MALIKDIIRQFFQNKNWDFIEKPDAFLFFIEVEGHKLLSSFHYKEMESLQVIFHTHFPINVPKNKTDKLALLLTDINCNVTIGNFELDRKSGNIRYKTSIETTIHGLNDELLNNLVNANFSISTTYYSQILEFLVKKEKAKNNE